MPAPARTTHAKASLRARTLRTRAGTPIARLATVGFACSLASVLLLGITPASADSTSSALAGVNAQIGATQAQVAAIEQQIAQQGKQLNDLEDQYEEASVTVQRDQAALAITSAKLTAAKAAYQIRKNRLTADAVHAYVYGIPTQNLVDLFTTPAVSSKAAVRSTYESAVIGDVSKDVAQVQQSEVSLTATETSLQSEQQQATLAAAQVQQTEQGVQAAQQAAQHTLGQVTSTLATEVAAQAVYEAQQAAAAALAAQQQRNQEAAAAAAQQATAAASVATSVGDTSAASTATNAANQAAAAAGSVNATLVAANGNAPSSAGQAAVAAAESDLGTPYVWGGTTPGVGLDCSGLVQSAWGVAGVSIPRTTQEQYAGLPLVSLADVEPGDLLYFYNLDGDDTIDHVVMYVGSGPYGTATIIQAPYTGANVSYAPIWSTGLEPHAGRP